MSPIRVLLCFLVLYVGVAAMPASALAGVPPNDDFATAADLGSGMTASASGSNLWATAEAGEPGRASGPAMSSVWYRWTAPQGGVVRVRTCGSNFDTTLAVFRGSALGALGRVAANDDSCGNRSALRFFAISGASYYIAVDGFREVQGSIELKLRVLTTPPNDDLANAQDLGNDMTASATGTNRDATAEPREPDHARRRAIASVWYRWTSPADGTFQVKTCGSDFDTVMSVYTGTGLDDLRSVASSDDSCSTQSLARFRARAGETYHIAVDSYGRTRGTIQFKLSKPRQDSPRRTSVLRTPAPSSTPAATG